MKKRAGVWQAKDVWEHWEEAFLQVSEFRYGHYVPEAALFIAVIITAAKDRDIKWLNSPAFKGSCMCAGLDPSAVYANIKYSLECLDGDRLADFNLDEQ